MDTSPESQMLYNSSPISAFIRSVNDMTLPFNFNFKGESLDLLVSIFVFVFFYISVLLEKICQQRCRR